MQRRGSQLPQQQAAQRRPSLQLPTLDDIGALLDGLPEKGSSTAMAAAAEEVAHHGGSLGRGADPAAELLASHAHARQHSGSLGTASPSKGPPSSAGTIVRSTEARPEPSTAVRGQPPGHRHAGWHSSAVLEQAAGHGHSQRVSLQEASNLGRNQALRAFIADGRPGHFAGAGECCTLLALLLCCFCRQAGSPPSGWACTLTSCLTCPRGWLLLLLDRAQHTRGLAHCHGLCRVCRGLAGSTASPPGAGA